MGGIYGLYSLVVERLATMREQFQCSTECGHTVGDMIGLVLCNRKLYMAEHELIVKRRGLRVILRSLLELIHDKQNWRYSEVSPHVMS